MLNPEWLRYFTVLAESGSFHAAAARLHITPQAMSHAVAGLEAHFKVSLVERGHRMRGLTDAGEFLLDEARQALQGMENVERSMAAWGSKDPQGPVTIASAGLCQNYLLPTLLTELLVRYPQVVPRLHQMIPDDVEQWVTAGDVDVGLLLQPPTRPDLTWIAGLQTPYVIVGKPQPVRPWDEFGYIVPRLFRREVAQPLDGWPTNTFKRRVIVETDLLDTALNLAEAGVGVTFVPLLATLRQLQQGSLAIVAEAPCQFTDTLFAIWRKGVRPTPAARAVISALETFPYETWVARVAGAPH